jgi:16S rRNA (adenine1518-N6/adenine1519-N6)-dimethyltransferase
LLLQRAEHVLAIEKDHRLVGLLQERFREPVQTKTLTLVEDDAFEYLRRERRDWSGWKLVANLPYSVASPLLVELAQSSPGPEQMVATLQIEVARRLMAKPGDADYGILTLLVQLEYEPGGWFKIPAVCFFPEPEVDSACVSLRRREGGLLSTSAQKETFVRLVKRGFSQRRKMLLKLLKADWEAARLEAALEKAGIPVSTRAESVSVAQFAELAIALNEQG